MRIANCILQIGVTVAIALATAGCPPKAPPPPKSAWYGETQPLEYVVDKVNQNNAQLPSLWARHYFEATLFEEGYEKSHFVNGDGILLYRRPRELRLIGNKDLAGTIFEIGSVDDRFWMKVVPETDTMWWGYYRNVGKPCAQAIPIRPDLVVEVLGIGPIDADFMKEPAPVMRFNNDADAYMFVWSFKSNSRGRPRWVAQKEIWYDRKSFLPTLVNLFDGDGRIILRAYLRKHEPVEIEGVPEDRWPKVATEFDLFFPDSRTKMKIELSNVSLSRRGVPNDKSIRFPAEPGVSKVIQIDANCGD